jgi:hypothetical protein
MTKHPKRPRDLNQWAKHMVDLATGAAPELASEGERKNPRAVNSGMGNEGRGRDVRGLGSG